MKVPPLVLLCAICAVVAAAAVVHGLHRGRNQAPPPPAAQPAFGYGAGVAPQGGGPQVQPER